jgi:Protein of unknown function (DUF4236)
MGWRFRRSVRLFPGIRLNFSLSGVSASVGVRGAHVTVGPRGTHTTVGLPGTGLSYSETQGTHQEAHSEAQPAEAAESLPKGRALRGWLWIVLLSAILIAIAVLLSSCSEKPQVQSVLGPGIGPAPRTQAASDPRIVYELREKCGSDAQAWYLQDIIKASVGQPAGMHIVNTGFTSHYNERLNRCFAIATATLSLRDAKTKVTRIGTMSALTDVLENKDFGQFFNFNDMPKPMACNVNEHKCDSQETFDGLAASFMNE